MIGEWKSGMGDTENTVGEEENRWRTYESDVVSVYESQ